MLLNGLALEPCFHSGLEGCEDVSRNGCLWWEFHSDSDCWEETNFYDQCKISGYCHNVNAKRRIHTKSALTVYLMLLMMSEYYQLSLWWKFHCNSDRWDLEETDFCDQCKFLGIAIMQMQKEDYTQKVHWLFILHCWWCQKINQLSVSLGHKSCTFSLRLTIYDPGLETTSTW